VDDNVQVDSDAEDADQQNTKGDQANIVVEVSEQNLAEFTLNDIVMPMIGYDTKLPSNEDLR
jgi:hypothetical protein